MGAPLRTPLWIAFALVAGVVAIGVGAPWLVREWRAHPEWRARAPSAHHRLVSLEVGGMICPACVAKVRMQLAAVPGVEVVNVWAKRQRFDVVCADGVADTTLTAAVRHAGPGYLGMIVRR